MDSFYVLSLTNELNLSNYEFPKGLEELYISESEISDISSLKFPEGLKDLCITKSKIPDVSDLKIT